MTDPTTFATSPQTPANSTAGALLRQYREAESFEIDTLAQILHISADKLRSLEADRLDELPDVLFARTLTLAVCRQLKRDAAPILALLPRQRASRFGASDERGLDSPLDRPSFLPQSGLLFATRSFTPMRWAALVLFALALVLAFGPNLSAVMSSDEPATEPLAETVVTPTPLPGAAPVAAPAVIETIPSPSAAVSSAAGVPAPKTTDAAR